MSNSIATDAIKKTKAQINGNIARINTDTGSKWAIASAAFIFKTPQPCVILVKRKGKTRYSGKWALIAGATSCKKEWRHPSKAVRREAREELILIKNGKKINLLCSSKLLTNNIVKIIDNKTGDIFKDKGELFAFENEVLFMQIYLVNISTKNIVLEDGELHKGKLLNRLVALVPINNLQGRVMPHKLFQCGKEIGKREIDLSNYQTPTLDWFRKRSSYYTQFL